LPEFQEVSRKKLCPGKLFANSRFGLWQYVVHEVKFVCHTVKYDMVSSNHNLRRSAVESWANVSQFHNGLLMVTLKHSDYTRLVD